MIKAIVTGHSKGLGLGICKALLANGHPVLGLSRTGNPGLQARHPDLLRQVVIDLSSTEATQDISFHGTIKAFIAHSSQVLLINNAGVVSPIGPPNAQQLVDIAQAVQLNVTVPLLLTALLTQSLEPAQQLRVLHVSSGAGQSAYPGWSVYCATKAALDMHAQAVQLDNTLNVTICSLAPGVIDTGMQAQIRQVDESLFPNKARFQQLKSTGALSNPDTAGKQLVTYLLSDQFGQLAVDDLRNHGTS